MAAGPARIQDTSTEIMEGCAGGRQARIKGRRWLLAHLECGWFQEFTPEFNPKRLTSMISNSLQCGVRDEVGMTTD